MGTYPDTVYYRAFEAEARAVYAYLGQATTWHAKGPRDVPITEMNEEWRRNAAALLRDGATLLAQQYAFGMVFSACGPDSPAPGSAAGDALDQEHAAMIEQARVDPLGLVQATPLYQALAGGGRS